MSPLVVGILGIGVLFILLALRMQIGFAMCFVGFGGFLVLSNFDFYEGNMIAPYSEKIPESLFGISSHD